jgi:6-pyruvoyl-tetrahydropterin synthase
LTFAASSLDECGFVIDFGGNAMQKIKEELLRRFDHATVLSKDDRIGAVLDKLTCDDRKLFDLFFVDDASAEGLAYHVGNMADSIVNNDTAGRVRVLKCVCFEDSKNSATWEREAMG